MNAQDRLIVRALMLDETYARAMQAENEKQQLLKRVEELEKELEEANKEK